MITKKNIIFMKDGLHNFKDYGIEIPLLNDRVKTTISNLKNAGFNIPQKDKSSHIKFEDLKFAHTKEFHNEVQQNPRSFILKTYELLNKDGSYHRFNPNHEKIKIETLVHKGLIHINGTYLTCLKALESSWSYHLGGGMHHAMSFSPRGFCMYNDIAITLKKMIQDQNIKNAIVIDMDAHKGDGTSEITKDESKIRTYSIHMEKGWPLDNPNKQDHSFIPSDCDVPISIEDNYLKKFKSTVSKFITKVDLCIVVHGADVYEKDTLESSQGIKLTRSEVKERDLFIFNLLYKNKINQAWVMGGGYGKNAADIFSDLLLYICHKKI